MNIHSKPEKFDWLDASIIFSALAILSFFTVAYLIHWEIGYNSDTALISLMARHIAYDGERPLFVWSVGYQGILIEAYLTALFFKSFGSGVITANLGVAVSLWAALIFWTLAVRRAFGIRIACCTTFLVVVSCPIFYHINLRTLPNFPEAFLLGSLFLWGFMRFWERFSDPERRGGATFFWALFLGGVAGFAAYTFLVSWYFVLAVGATLFSISLLPNLHDFFVPYRRLEKKNKLRSLFFATTLLSGLIFISGLLLTFTPWNGVWVGILKCNLDPINVMVPGIAGFAGLHLILYALRATREQWRHWACFVMGLFVGYLPALYFKFILHGHSIKKLRIRGTWADVERRLHFLFEGLEAMFSSTSNPLLGALCLGLALGATAFFLGSYFRELFFASASPARKRTLPVQAPFFFIPLVILTLFMITILVTEVARLRYAIFLLPVVCLAMVYTAQTIITRYPHRLTRVGIAVVLGLFLLKSGILFRDDLERKPDRWAMQALFSGPLFPPREPWDKLIKVLRENDIHFGYTDYWYAYAINFLTNEAIILQPMATPYCPHYAPLVSQAFRIGYLAHGETTPEPTSALFALHGRRYRVEKQIPIGDFTKLFVLLRQSR